MKFGFENAGHQLREGGGRVEGGDAAGAVEGVAGVAEPEDFAIGGVEEGDVEAVEVEGV